MCYIFNKQKLEKVMSIKNIIVGIDSSNIASEVLKVGHHGSNTSSSEKFLKEVQPLYGVISVGYNNRFGHPDSAVLERMEKLGIKIYRTDLNGAIVFQATKDNLKVQAFR